MCQGRFKISGISGCIRAILAVMAVGAMCARKEGVDLSIHGSICCHATSLHPSQGWARIGCSFEAHKKPESFKGEEKGLAGFASLSWQAAYISFTSGISGLG